MKMKKCWTIILNTFIWRGSFGLGSQLLLSCCVIPPQGEG
jgi:hypothetical protein